MGDQADSQAQGTQKGIQKLSSGDEAFGLAIHHLQVGKLNTLKHTRDNIDAGVAKLGTLSAKQRDDLAFQALMCILILYQPRIGPISLTSSKEFEGKRPINVTDQALESIKKVLQMDTSKIPAKQYETMVKQVWKAARATLNKTLEQKDNKALLDSLGASKK